MGRTREITLPRLIGGRETANEYVAELDAKPGDIVVIHCRNLSSASPSFADQLVRRLLDEGDVAALVVVAAGTEFHDDISESAVALSVADRVHFVEDFSAPDAVISTAAAG